MIASEQAFTGRVVLVTGGARGIGAEIARRFLGARATVVILDPAAAEASAIAGDGSSARSRLVTVPVDVTDHEGVRAALERIDEVHGRLDVLVNNAGISPKHGGRKASVADMDITEWRRVLEVNLTAAFHLCKLAVPRMARNRWGRIILISSQAGRTRSAITGAHYAASKAGLIGLARILADETAPLGITVNSVAPGRIVTAMTDQAGAEINADYARAIPVGRLGDPGDVAAAVLYLASEAAGFVTGTVLDVNGGYFMP